METAPLNPPSVAAETAVWYFQIGNTAEEGIAGPCTVAELQLYYQAAYIDGLTPLWREGMEDWVCLSDCTELKHYFTVVDEESVERVEDTSLETQPHRLPLEEVAEIYKYVSEDGIPYVFDVVAKEWRTQEEYHRLIEASTVLDRVDPELKDKKMKNMKKRKEYRERMKLKKESGLFMQGKKNPSVYVTQLPDDITFEELESLFKRAGVIKIDPNTTSPKIRIYQTSDGKPKGDALVSFVKEESVELAKKYLNDYEIRPSCHIKVEQAVFEGYSASKLNLVAPARTLKLDRRKYLAAKYEQERLMSWGEDIDDGSGRRIVLFRPMFSKAEAEAHEDGDVFYGELKKEIEEEIRKLIPVEKVTPIARHPQGIVAVKFKTNADAEAAIEHFRDRLFAGNQLVVYFFDRKTDLKSQCLPSRRHSSTTGYDGHENTEDVFAQNKAFDAYESKASETEPLIEPNSKKFKRDTTEQEIVDKEEERLDDFGRWLEEQSSDEEFSIDTEE